MEHIDPLVAAPAEDADPAVRADAPGASQPVPTAEQEQAADGVFAEQQARLASALLGVSTGLGLLHHLAVETFGGKAEEQAPPAPPRRKDEEPAR